MITWHTKYVLSTSTNLVIHVYICNVHVHCTTICIFAHERNESVYNQNHEASNIFVKTIQEKTMLLWKDCF